MDAIAGYDSDAREDAEDACRGVQAESTEAAAVAVAVAAALCASKGMLALNRPSKASGAPAHHFAPQPLPGFPHHNHQAVSTVKRARREPGAAAPAATSQCVQFLPGRYVSRREREALLSASESIPPSSFSVAPAPQLAALPTKDAPRPYALRHGTDLPSHCLATWVASAGPLSRVHWSPDGRLVAVAALDGACSVWDPFQAEACVRRLQPGVGGLRDGRWSGDGAQILVAGLANTAAVLDVESTASVTRLPHDARVTAVRWDPASPALALTGTAAATLLVWDTRAPAKPVVCLVPTVGSVLDVEYLDDRHVVASTDAIAKSAIDKAIMVWDARTGGVVSNQVFSAGSPCLALCRHPYRREFVALTGAGYVAVFDAARPFRMAPRRFDGPSAAGFNVGCSISSDGTTLASASADGTCMLFDFASTALRGRIFLSPAPCLHVALHPTWPYLAAIDWAGQLGVWAPPKS